MKRTIVNPHWTNNARTVIAAEFHYDDGRIVNAVISDTDTSNPDLAEIQGKFSSEEMENNTRKEIQKRNTAMEKQRQEEASAKERKLNEDLFAVKLKIFDIEAVKTATNRKLKSQIRRSKSDVEAMAWAAALLLDISNTQQTQEEDTSSTE